MYNRLATGMLLASSLNLLLDITVLQNDYYKYTEFFQSYHYLFIVASVRFFFCRMVFSKNKHYSFILSILGTWTG